jgi:hypothetical protein
MVKATAVKMNSVQATIYNNLHEDDPALAQDYALKLAQSMRQTKDTIASGILQQQFGFDPNKREAYMMPLSQLVTIWQAKYGDQWVQTDLLPVVQESAMFFQDAFWRLRNNGLLEEAQDNWFRLKEDA